MMSPVVKGIFVAFATLIVIAMGFVVATQDYFMDVLAIGTFPAVLAGLGFGTLEPRLRRASPAARLLTLASLGCGIVALLVMLVELAGAPAPVHELALLSFIPVTAAAAILERSTRVAAAPALAPASIRS